jgi:hypothetical protein
MTCLSTPTPSWTDRIETSFWARLVTARNRRVERKLGENLGDLNDRALLDLGIRRDGLTPLRPAEPNPRWFHHPPA